MSDLEALLRNIVELWSQTSTPEVVKAAKYLREVVESSKLYDEWDDSKGYKCSPPNLQDMAGHQLTSILDQIRKVNDKLSWKIPLQVVDGDANRLLAKLGGCDRLKSAMVVGTPSLGSQYHSDKVYAGLVWVAPGTVYPPHAHHALEMYHILAGRAQWGPSPGHLTVRGPGEMLVHQSGQPHMMVVPKDQYLLAFYAWIGDINGSYWWCDPGCGQKYKDVGSPEDAQSYYDNMAEDYEAVVRGWGYNCPEVVADKVAELIDSTKLSNAKILDLGCGDGLVGVALKVRGFNNIYGYDISDKMVELALSKKVYQVAKQADLNKPLALAAGCCDVITCVGVTTYLNPTVISDWLRLLRTGGYCVFTVKSGVLEQWRATQDRLEERGDWKSVYISKPLYYLPGLMDPKLERVFVYVYRK